MNRARDLVPIAVVALLAVGSLAGCGTIAKGTTEAIQVTSSPPGAQFSVSPSGQQGVTPAEVKLERRHDHTFLFSLPGHSTRKAYVRRTLAVGPANVNALSCLVLPFVCFGLGAIDEASGGHFDLLPDPLHVVLVPGDGVEVSTVETRVVFFNGTPKSTVHFSIDGGTECALEANQFTTRTLRNGEHQIDAYHWDVFKMAGRTTLDIDGAELFVALFPTLYSTRAAFANELPKDYEESCVQPTS